MLPYDQTQWKLLTILDVENFQIFQGKNIENVKKSKTTLPNLLNFKLTNVETQ
jgi:hypothetical protein